jgi:hypothetical protein
MEMWEAAVTQVPIVLFPVVNGGWTLNDARTLLSDLMVQMHVRNPACMNEVMAHVGKQGVTNVRYHTPDATIPYTECILTDGAVHPLFAIPPYHAKRVAVHIPCHASPLIDQVREVEDVLLAHIGLVRSLERPGRPASTELDRRLCSHLKKDVADLSTWLPAYNAVVEQRLSYLSWQSWGSDNQIIASVQSLVDECALTLGRARPEWKDHWIADNKHTAAGRVSKGFSMGLLRFLCCQRQAPSGGRLLIICARDECGGTARLLQRQFSDKLQCEVVIGSDLLDTWHGEVDSATRGVVLLQSLSVLREPVRLLQLFEAMRQRHPVACVNVVGGGYDFAKVKPLLLSLSDELSRGKMATLRAELMEHGNGVGQLASSLSDALPHTISVFFNPAAGDVMMDAAVMDILDKLKRGAELLHTGAISSELLSTVQPDAGNAGVAPGRLPAPMCGSDASQSGAREAITYYI